MALDDGIKEIDPAVNGISSVRAKVGRQYLVLVTLQVRQQFTINRIPKFDHFIL